AASHGGLASTAHAAALRDRWRRLVVCSTPTHERRCHGRANPQAPRSVGARHVHHRTAADICRAVVARSVGRRLSFLLGRTSAAAAALSCWRFQLASSLVHSLPVPVCAALVTFARSAQARALVATGVVVVRVGFAAGCERSVTEALVPRDSCADRGLVLLRSLLVADGLWLVACEHARKLGLAGAISNTQLDDLDDCDGHVVCAARLGGRAARDGDRKCARELVYLVLVVDRLGLWAALSI